MPKAKRGEIWIVDLGLVQKVRPCLIVSVEFSDQERAVVTYVPRTTTLRGTKYEVAHSANGFDIGDFDAQGIGSVPEVKLVRRISVLDAPTMGKIEMAIKSWLHLS